MNLKIINLDTNEGVPYATVSGYSANGVYTGLGTVANSNGVASFDANNWLSLNVVKLVITSAGFNQAETPLSFSLDNSEILLAPNLGDLGEVIVTGIISSKTWVLAIILLIVVGTLYFLSKK